MLAVQVKCQKQNKNKNHPCLAAVSCKSPVSRMKSNDSLETRSDLPAGRIDSKGLDECDANLSKGYQIAMT